MTDDAPRNTMDRRAFVRRAGTAGAAGAMVWAAPSVTTLSRAFAQAPGTPVCGQIAASFDDLVVRSAPDSARSGVLTSVTQNFIWLEGIATSAATINLANPSGVTGVSGYSLPGSIPAGKTFAVFMIHAQTDPGTGNGNLQKGGVEFDGAILGVTSTAETLVATDGLAGNTEYDNEDLTDPRVFGRRFEEPDDPNGDRAKVSQFRVDVETKQGSQPDQMRVFVECLLPDQNSE